MNAFVAAFVGALVGFVVVGLGGYTWFMHYAMPKIIEGYEAMALGRSPHSVVMPPANATIRCGLCAVEQIVPMSASPSEYMPKFGWSVTPGDRPEFRSGTFHGLSCFACSKARETRAEAIEREARTVEMPGVGSPIRVELSRSTIAHVSIFLDMHNIELQEKCGCFLCKSRSIRTEGIDADSYEAATEGKAP